MSWYCVAVTAAARNHHWTTLGLIGNGHYLGKAWCCSSAGLTALGTARGWWWERKDQPSASFPSGTHKEERNASASLSECIPHAAKQAIAYLTPQTLSAWHQRQTCFPPLLIWLLLACQSPHPLHLAQQHSGLFCKGCSMQVGGGSHMTRYPEKHTAVKVSGTGKLWLSQMGAGQPLAQSWEQEVWDGRFSASRVRWWWQTFLDGAIFFPIIFYCRAQCGAGTHTHTTSCFVSAKNTCPCAPTNPACAVHQQEWLSQGCVACIMLTHSSWSGSCSREKPYCWRTAIPKRIKASLWSTFHTKIFSFILSAVIQTVQRLLAAETTLPHREWTALYFSKTLR